MSLDDDPNAAPCYDPGAVGLPWWRRALAQGVGYMLPSSGFALIPFFFVDDYSPLVWVLAVLAMAGILVFFLGVTVIAHWSEAWRWVWIAGLIGCIVVLGLVTDGDARPLYFVVYATAAIASLIAWRKARVAVSVLGLVALGVSYVNADSFGVVMGLAAIVLGWGLGTALEGERMRQALDRAQQRTAVLAVAAERERIGRDLHDILGHSLTTIAVKADLAGRLVGRSDDAARAEIATLGEVARQALADVRATASGMREVRLASELAAARSVLQAAGVECRAPSALPVLGENRSELFGYVVREAVTNVVRHAEATICTIDAGASFVRVTDDGRGIRNGAQRSGLRGLAERIAAAGGELKVVSGKGTQVLASFDEEEP